MNNDFNVVNNEFWDACDTLITNSKIIIDRHKGTVHPTYPTIVYEVDYGYLENTISMDGGGIDVWLGTDETKKLNAIICTVDLFKKDSEIKLLIGCTEEEMNYIYKFHNESRFMKGILIKRDEY